MGNCISLSIYKEVDGCFLVGSVWEMFGVVLENEIMSGKLSTNPVNVNYCLNSH